MRKVKQIVVFVVVFILLFISAWLASILAKTYAVEYFEKEAIYNDWVNLNTVLYLFTSLLVWITSIPFIYYCRRGTLAWDNRKKRFPMMVSCAVITALVIIVISSVVCHFLNIVTTGDNLMLFHFIYLLLIPATLLVTLLCILIIKPIANVIKY